MNYFFVNKNKRNKDIKICKQFAKNYFEFSVITTLFQVKNRVIERQLLYLILLNYTQTLLINKSNYKTYHKDISFLSGRTKSIITKYGISRTDFKKLMNFNQIPNLTKSSW